MSGDVFGPSRLGYQPYQGPMPFQFQSGRLPGAANSGVAGIGATNPFASQEGDSFSSGFGGMTSPMGMSPSLNMGMGNMGMMGGMGTPAISGSTLQLMTQINMMLASVMQGLMSFIQTILASVQSKASQPGTMSTASTGSEPGTGVPTENPSETSSKPSNQAEAAVDWALNEEKKGITEASNQDYISKTYSKGKVEAWCADFVSTAFAKTGGSPFGHMPAVKSIKAWGEKNGKYFAKGSKQPKKGDIVIFGNGSHTGLVVGIDSKGNLLTVEGNTSDALKRRTHSMSGGYVTGFVRT